MNAEYGWNFELGFKGIVADQRLEFDVAAYYFALKNAIVRRNNAAGQEYFINAGGTTQNGIEAMLKYSLYNNPLHYIAGVKFWSSYSFQPYRFDNYQQGLINYSGNALTGVPKNTWVSGLELTQKKGFYWRISINSTSSIPLTDGNDAYAKAYQLLQSVWGYPHSSKVHVLFGIDNLLNQTYCLGNDINAAAKRYFNPAPPRNCFLSFQYSFKSNQHQNHFQP